MNGPWALDYQGATATGDSSSIRLNYHAKKVYILAGGTGTLTVNGNGKSSARTISGPPNLDEVAADGEAGPGQLEVRVSPGLQVFSFTYG